MVLKLYHTGIHPQLQKQSCSFYGQLELRVSDDCSPYIQQNNSGAHFSQDYQGTQDLTANTSGHSQTALVPVCIRHQVTHTPVGTFKHATSAKKI